MAIEHSIYTTCKKKIDTDSVGLGFFSYTNKMETLKETSNIISTVANNYISPKDQSAWMLPPVNGELNPKENDSILKNHPESYIFMPVIDLDGDKYIMSYGRNFGRDLNGSRPGNIFVHTLVCDEKDIKTYPCFYFKSRTLITEMTREFFVNYPDDKKPGYLKPLEQLINSNYITQEKIVDFLSKENRLEILSMMFQNIIDYNDEQNGQRKSIIIHDKKENVLLWISALSILFPVKNALGLSYNTYAYNPTEQEVMICGAYYKLNKEDTSMVNDTDYNYETYVNNPTIHLYDFENSSYPDNIEYTDSNFIELIQSNLENVFPYRDFIAEKTTYYGINPDYISGFYFYEIFQLGISVSMLDINSITKACEFGKKYISNDLKKQFANMILQELVSVELSEDIQQVIVQYISFCIENNIINSAVAYNTLMENLVALFKLEGTTWSEYREKFNIVHSFIPTNSSGFESDYIDYYGLSNLLNDMLDCHTTWKNVHILMSIGGYFKQKNSSPEKLSISPEIGSLEGKIIYYTTYHLIEENKLNVLEAFQRAFKPYEYNIEMWVKLISEIAGVWIDLHKQAKDMASLKEYVASIITQASFEDMKLYFTFMAKYQIQSDYFQYIIESWHLNNSQAMDFNTISRIVDFLISNLKNSYLPYYENLVELLNDCEDTDNPTTTLKNIEITFNYENMLLEDGIINENSMLKTSVFKYNNIILEQLSQNPFWNIQNMPSLSSTLNNMSKKVWNCSIKDYPEEIRTLIIIMDMQNIIDNKINSNVGFNPNGYLISANFIYSDIKYLKIIEAYIVEFCTSRESGYFEFYEHFIEFESLSAEKGFCKDIACKILNTSFSLKQNVAMVAAKILRAALYKNLDNNNDFIEAFANELHTLKCKPSDIERYLVSDKTVTYMKKKKMDTYCYPENAQEFIKNITTKYSENTDGSLQDKIKNGIKQGSEMFSKFFKKKQ